MNCESRRPRKQRSPQREGIRQRTERINEINGHKRSTRGRRNSKQEGKQGGQVKKEQRGEQGKSFAFHLARRLTVQQRSSIDVCHGSQARSGEFQFSVLKRAERSEASYRVRARNIKADAKVSRKKMQSNKIQACCRKCGKADVTPKTTKIGCM